MTISTYLRERKIKFQMILHNPEPSATRRARSIHVAGRSVAKSVLVNSDSGYFLAVLPATHRIDLPRFEKALGLSGVSIAREDELDRVFFDCERGALPPFGRLYGLRTVVDAALAAGSEIVIDGNTRHEGFRIGYRDFERLEEPTRVRFAEFSLSGGGSIQRAS